MCRSRAAEQQGYYSIEKVNGFVLTPGGPDTGGLLKLEGVGKEGGGVTTTVVSFHPIGRTAGVVEQAVVGVVVVGIWTGAMVEICHSFVWCLLHTRIIGNTSGADEPTHPPSLPPSSTDSVFRTCVIYLVWRRRLGELFFSPPDDPPAPAIDHKTKSVADKLLYHRSAAQYFCPYFEPLKLDYYPAKS